VWHRQQPAPQISQSSVPAQKSQGGREFQNKEKEEKKSTALQVLREAEKAENRYDGVKFRVVGVLGKE